MIGFIFSFLFSVLVVVPGLAFAEDFQLDEFDRALLVERMTIVAKAAVSDHFLKAEGKKVDKVLAFDGGPVEGSKEKFTFHVNLQMQDGKNCESDLEATLSGQETKVIGKKVRCGLNTAWTDKDAFESTAIEQELNGKTQIKIQAPPAKMLSVKETNQHSS